MLPETPLDLQTILHAARTICGRLPGAVVDSLNRSRNHPDCLTIDLLRIDFRKLEETQFRRSYVRDTGSLHRSMLWFVSRLSMHPIRPNYRCVR
jgi:hypothetical protein